MKNFIYVASLLAAITGASAQTTLYSGDGTLASNRIVTQAGRNLTFKPTTGSLFINGTTGFVGVNTLTPTTNFDVNGNIKGTVGIFTKSLVNGQTFATNADRLVGSMSLSAGTLTGEAPELRTLSFLDMPTSNMDSNPVLWFNITNRNNMTRFRVRASQDGGGEFDLFNKVQSAVFQVLDDGNENIRLFMPKANSFVGIGTTSYTDGVDIFKLSVAGNIRAQRVKVYTTWADYVFEEGYKLPTLEEVEQHIKEKGHLQDIPSAAEVEAKGIELGEMNKLLLQKVEELTLYMIEQKKTTDLQEKHIKLLEEQVKLLSEKK